MLRKLLRAWKAKYPALFLWYIRMKIRGKKLLIPDQKYVENYYCQKHGVKPDLVHPKKFSEHVVKILLTPPPQLKVFCADKYEARKYVEEKVGKEVLNELYGVFSDYGSFRQSYEQLPDQFVIKATHGSSWNYICKDKGQVDEKELKRLIQHWLKSNFYHHLRELVYRDIPPRIVCEKYMEDDSGGLTDYKVHCFNGQPKFLHMVVGRYSEMVYNTYDVKGNWLDLDFSQGHADVNVKLNPDLPLAKLLDYSRALAADFDYVRVDFYFVQRRLIFGEFTFTHMHGHYGLPVDKDLQLGRFFDQER